MNCTVKSPVNFTVALALRETSDKARVVDICLFELFLYTYIYMNYVHRY